jgi:hypothetical protein
LPVFFRPDKNVRPPDLVSLFCYGSQNAPNDNAGYQGLNNVAFFRMDLGGDLGIGLGHLTAGLGDAVGVQAKVG